MFIHLDTYQLSEFKEFYYSYCLNYGDLKENRSKEYSFLPQYPASRTGDTFLRECYKSLVFVLFDKFGEIGLNKYYKTLYRLVYKERIIKYQVKYNFVAQFPHNYFRIIVEAKDLSDLVELERLVAEEITIGKSDEGFSINGKVVNDKLNFILDGKEQYSISNFIVGKEN